MAQSEKRGHFIQEAERYREFGGKKINHFVMFDEE